VWFKNGFRKFMPQIGPKRRKRREDGGQPNVKLGVCRKSALSPNKGKEEFGHAHRRKKCGGRCSREKTKPGEGRGGVTIK